MVSGAGFGMVGGLDLKTEQEMDRRFERVEHDVQDLMACMQSNTSKQHENETKVDKDIAEIRVDGTQIDDRG